MSRQFTNVAYKLTNATAPVTIAPLTVCGWVKRTGTPNNWAGLISLCASTGGNNRYEASINGNSAYQISSIVVTTSQGNVQGSVVPLNTWSFFAVMFDSNCDSSATGAHAVLGTNKTDGAVYRKPTAQAVVLGGETIDGNNAATGFLLGHVAVFNKVLSTGDISSLAGGALPSAVSGCVAYWPLDDTGSTEHDAVGAYTLTVTGATHSTDEPPITAATASALLARRRRFFGGQP